MPANHPPDVRRGKVPQALFWGGMALAPLAVLILLFGQSAGSLRVAVVLAVLTIVLLAVSIALRPSVEMVRVDIEHRVLDEMERMRIQAREDTTNAARHTHKALSDKIYELTGTIEDLRSQIDEVQVAGFFDPHGPPAIGPGPGGPGMRRTETVHVTRRTTIDDTGTVYGSRAAAESGRMPSVDGEWRERTDDRYGDDRWDGAGQGSRWAEVRYDDSGRELRLGERRTGYHADDRGVEYRVEDRWSSVRRDDPEDRGWSGGRPEQRALTSGPGQPAPFIDSRDDDRYGDRGHDRDRGYARGRDDDRDRGYDRHDGRDRGYDGYGDRDRGYDRFGDRGHDRYGEHDRYGDQDRGYGRDRGHDRDRGYERDRGYDRDRFDDRDRGYDRGDDRGYERPRPRDW